MIPVQSECMTNATTRIINDWEPETRSLLERLVAAGCTLLEGDNGEYKFKFPERTTPENYPAAVAKFIEDLTACDESHLWVKVPGYDRPFWLFLVYGNSPGELVSDYSCPKDLPYNDTSFALNPVTMSHYDEWSSKPQPKKEVAR